MSKKPLLLLDGDIFLYESTSVTEHAYDYGNDVWVMSANLEEAKDLFNAQINGIKSAIGTTRICMCLSDGTANFRKDLTETYKSQRKSTRKPLIYPPMRAWVMENFAAIVKPKLEADDVMGILSTQPDKNEDRIIVSTDKDMQTIPGLLWRDNEVKTISLEDADRYWLTQTLTGDPTDGYKGCPGVGAVGAQKVLGNTPSYGAVELAFMKAGLTKADALLSARLAKILRWENWDIATQTVKLWEPRNDK